MKLFRSKESKKKHEKAKGSVSDGPVPSVPPNQHPANTVTYITRTVPAPQIQRTVQQPAPQIQRSVQQPAPQDYQDYQDYQPQRNSYYESHPVEDHPVPVRKSQDYPQPNGPRLRAQPPPAHRQQAPTHMSQPPPATGPRSQAHRQAPMHMSQPSPGYTSEVHVETLKPASTPTPHPSYASSQPPPASLKEAPAHANNDDSASALKETYGVDPVSQMEHNAVTRELVKQFIADIWNRGDLDLIPTVCAKGIRFNGSSGMDRVGHAGFKKMVTTIRNSLEDYHCEIHSMVVEGNKAFCRLRFMGRHVGKLLGYEPTGRQVSWMGAMEFTVIDGLIVKVWELGDMTSLEQQLK